MILEHFRNQPLAIRESALATMDATAPAVAKFNRAAAEQGVKSRFASMNRLAGAFSNPPRTGRLVAVVDLFGPIAHRRNIMTDLFGGVVLESLSKALDELLTNDRLQALVLNIDSPGGGVSLVDEVATKLRNARDSGKRIIAVANSEVASAAYWIASSASEIVVTPSGEIGSIGVVAVHADVSGADKKDGIKRTVIRAGRYKWDGHPYEPLSNDARARIQEGVDRYYDQFTKAVAKGRGTTPSAVKAGYGQGRMLGAKQAVAAGLADRVATLDQVLRELGTRH